MNPSDGSSKTTRPLPDQSPAPLSPTLYMHLKRLSASYMRRERPGHTLAATGLLHEAYLRVRQSGGAAPGNVRELFIAMANSMRRVLVDYARRRASSKRKPIMPDFLDSARNPRANDGILMLNLALDDLAAVNPRWSRVVELRYFAGLTIPEAAEILGVSPETVKLDWRFAKAWLRTRLDGGLSEENG